MSQASQTVLIGEEDWSICLCSNFEPVPSRLTHEKELCHEVNMTIEIYLGLRTPKLILSWSAIV